MSPEPGMHKNGKSIIGVIGVGVVGGAVSSYFESRGYALRHFDPQLGADDEAALNEADIVFICVPTPYMPGAGFDDAALEDAIARIAEPKVVVIKSTVLPGTTEAFQLRYPQHCFLFNPEFLREASAPQDFVRPDRQIVGYTAQSRHLAESLLSILPDAPYKATMTAREAEMTKYMTNVFLALKVTFANEIYDLCGALDIDYQRVREATAADERIGASHLDVFDSGYRGYGGKCLPKDTKALLALADRLDVPLRLVRTADRANDLLQLAGFGEPEAPLPLPRIDDGELSEERAA
jgi:UDPglucose 6-dehydrogenase